MIVHVTVNKMHRYSLEETKGHKAKPLKLSSHYHEFVLNASGLRESASCGWFGTNFSELNMGRWEEEYVPITEWTPNIQRKPANVWRV